MKKSNRSVKPLQEAAAGKGEALSELLAQYENVGSWPARNGTALALQSCALCFDSDDVSQAMNFLMGRGVVDADEEVRSRMLDAGETTRDLVIVSYVLMQDSCFSGLNKRLPKSTQPFGHKARGNVVQHCTPGELQVPKVSLPK